RHALRFRGDHWYCWRLWWSGARSPLPQTVAGTTAGAHAALGDRPRLHLLRDPRNHLRHLPGRESLEARSHRSASLRMNTKILMASSALVMAALGVAATFLPQEITAALGGSGRTLPLLVQVLGATYLGLATLNWMAKESLIGGIYSRPVSMGNFLHFAIAGIALVKAVAAGERAVAVLVCTAIYVVFAVAFGAVVFGRAKVAK